MKTSSRGLVWLRKNLRPDPTCELWGEVVRAVESGSTVRDLGQEQCRVVENLLPAMMHASIMVQDQCEEELGRFAPPSLLWKKGRYAL